MAPVNMPGTAGPEEIVGTFDLQAVATLLIRQAGLHEGRYEAGVQFGIIAGKFGFQPGVPAIPGVINTISGLVLLKSPADSQISVDAAVVNPRVAEPTQKPRAKKSAR